MVEDKLLELSVLVADGCEENDPWAELVEPNAASPVAPALTPAEFVSLLVEYSRLLWLL